MILPFHLFSLFSILQLIILFRCINHIHGTVTHSPATACVGDNITVECMLTPPNPGDTFTSSVPNFIIGETDTVLSAAAANGNGMHDGFSLSRFTASVTIENSTFLSGSITLLSYTTADNNTRMGCTALYAVGGNVMNLMDLIRTVRLVQAAPPPPVTIQSISSSNINASTCSATVTLNWLAPSPTDRTVQLYYLTLQNGTAVDSTAANTYSHSTTLLLNTLYSYSLTASSCAGNSTLSTFILNSVNSFSLQTGPSSIYLGYNNESSLFTINWGLSTESTPLLIQYSLRYNYSHTQGSTTIESSSNIMTSFSILSNAALTYAQSITAATFVGGVEVRTSITACLRITQQCGQSYSGVEMCNSTSSIYAPLLSTPVMTSTLIQPSSIPTASSTYIFIPPTPTPITVPATNGPSPTTGLNIAIIGGVIGGLFASVVFVLLFIIIIVLGVCLCFLKRTKKDSHRRPSDRVNITEPEHRYDNIDNAGAMPQDKSAEGPYYTQMSNLPVKQLTDTAPSKQENPYYSEMPNVSDKQASPSKQPGPHHYSNLFNLPVKQLTDKTPSKQENLYYNEVPNVKQLTESSMKPESPYYTEMSSIAGKQVSDKTPAKQEGPYYTQMSALTNQPPDYGNQ